MNQTIDNSKEQFCHQCDNHCPVDALQCGRGRKYFGVTDGDHDHGYDGEHMHEHSHDHGRGCVHKQLDGLAGLLHQSGRFVHHADLEDGELFQVLSDEEKATLQALLEKLSADWQTRFGGETAKCCHHGHHDQDGKRHQHKHEGHNK